MDKVQELQKSLHDGALKSPKRGFDSLYDKVCESYVIEAAWKTVNKKAKCAGVDGVTFDKIGTNDEKEFLRTIEEELKEGSYRPSPVLRIYIPKGNEDLRPIGIPTIKDRVAQTTVRLILEPIYEATFWGCSHGFRPGRGPINALKEVERRMPTSSHIVDADIERFFDQVRHKKLRILLEKRIRDDRLLDLIQRWLKSGVQEGRRYHETTEGVPQGGPLNPLLSNVYLHALDTKWETQPGGPGKLIRYADDMTILCGSRTEAEAAMEALDRELGKLHLRLAPQKSSIVEVHQGQEVTFLGLTHRVERDKETQAYRATSRPSEQAIGTLQRKAKRTIRKEPQSPEGYKNLSHSLKKHLGGWACYYIHATEAHSAFRELDTWCKNEVADWLARQTWPGSQKAIAKLQGEPMWVQPIQAHYSGPDDVLLS